MTSSQQQAVFAAQARDLGQIFVRRHRDADTAHDRLDDHFGDALRSLAEDGGFHVLDAGQAAARIIEAERATIAVRRCDVHEVAGIRLEFGLTLTHAAGIQRRQRGAVIGVIPADRLEAVFAGIFVLHVLPGDLEPGLVRLGARIHEIGVVAAAHQPVDLFRQRRRRHVHRGVRKIGKLPHLLGGDLGELGAAIADIDAPQPGHRVEILGTVGVDDGRTLPARKHHLLCLQHLVLDDRVQDVAEILLHHGCANRGIGSIGERHDGPRG